MRAARWSFVAGSVLLHVSFAAHAQKSLPEQEPAPAPLSGQAGAGLPMGSSSGIPFAGETWCALPLCREAQVMHKTGDARGALKIYQYVLDEVDVDEKVLAKPLLFYVIAALNADLGQLRAAGDALEKYQKYIGTRPDADLPLGQRRDDVDRLAQSLRSLQGRLRIGAGLSGVHVFVDGKDAGVTPLTKPLPLSPGVHRIEFAGAPIAAQDVEVPAGQEIVVLPPNAAPPYAVRTAGGQGGVDAGGGREPRPIWRVALGAAGLALGAGLIAGSVAPLQSDGKCASGGLPPCPTEINAAGQPVSRVIDGRGVGGALLGTGIVAAVVGTVLVAIPGKRRPLRAGVDIWRGVNLNLAMTF